MPEDQPLSQEDIDAALAGMDSDESGSPDPESASEPDGQASPAEDSATPQPPTESSTDESTETATGSDAGGAFDQDDIDALINQGDTPTDQPDPAPASEAEVSAASDPAGDVQLDSAGRPFDAAAAEMAAAIAEEKAAGPPPAPPAPEPAAPPPGSEPMSLPDFAAAGSPDEALKSIELLKDVGLQVKIELGRSRMLVEDVLRLGEGSVVELDKLAGDPVDVYVNDRLVVRGEVLVLNDNFCVRVNEIISDVWKEFQTA